ncbi:hypothetical protein GOBAR_DD16246 [Gossypium barbadense]|nr:hypothetical protein GOBAR_DD16246 [Gossypium barbadense]
MSKSWFDKGYNGVGPNDDFFDDVIKYLDLPLEDVEGPDGNGSTEDVNNFLLPVEEKNDGGEDWDCDFENLEPPPTNVLASLSSGFYVNNCKIFHSCFIKKQCYGGSNFASKICSVSHRLSAVAHSVKDALPEPWLKQLYGPSKQVGPTSAWFDANKCMGPPDNAVDCDMIDVQYQSEKDRLNLP